MFPSVDVEFSQILLLSVVVILWFYWLWTRRHLYRLSTKFPHYIGLPFFGCFLRIKHIDNTVSALGKMFGEANAYTIYTWFGLAGTIITADPEFIEMVLTSPDLLNKSATYLPLKRILGNGLLTSSAESWQRHRKLLNPIFKHNNLLGFLPIFNKAKRTIIKEFSNIANDNKMHGLDEMIKRLSMTIVGETALGRAMDEGEQVEEDLPKKFIYVLQRYSQQIVTGILKLDFIYVLCRTLEHQIQFLLNIVQEEINCKWRDFKAQTPTLLSAAANDCDVIEKPPIILIDRALELYQKGIFTWNNVTDEATTMIIGAFETTANALFSVLTMLAMHPDIQEQLFTEIKNHFPNKDFEMQFEDMAQLPYLDMVINETLRLAPPIPMLGREAVTDTKCCKEYTLPKGTQIIVSVYHLHRRTDIWGPKANEFDPDNFLPETRRSRPTSSYIPFSRGSRNCIGYRYSLLALKVLLAGLVRSYRFETEMNYTDLELIMNITLRYKNEPTFRIYSRE